jgi:hypothetical protein
VTNSAPTSIALARIGQIGKSEIVLKKVFQSKFINLEPTILSLDGPFGSTFFRSVTCRERFNLIEGLLPAYRASGHSRPKRAGRSP